MGEHRIVRRGIDCELHEFRRLAKHPGWTRVIAGVLVESADELPPETLRRLRVEAIVERLGAGAVVSHQSAALVYGLPQWNIPHDDVHVTKRNTTRRRSRDVIVHAAPLPGPVAVVDGLLVTTPARMIVDCARTLTFEQAVVIGDAAVRKFGVTQAELDRELDRARTRKGIAAARRAVAFLDGHSESVGESLSRIALARNNIVGFIPQGEVFSADGEFLGRADFFHESAPLLGEFDGDLKYDGPGGRTALRNEKRREDQLRTHGNDMVRWGWSEVHGTALRDRVNLALRRAASLPPRSGWVRQAALPAPVPLQLRYDW